MEVKAVLVFDGDNTLWDTDAVFRSAQLALLERFRGHIAPGDSQELLRTLRELDAHLVSLIGQFEYDFRLLSVAAAHLFSQSTTYQQAAEKALSGEAASNRVIIEAAEEAFQAFQSKIVEIPQLYPDTELVLTSIIALREQGNVVAQILLSEGNPSRLQRILDAHAIQRRGFFDEVIISNKSSEAFGNAKKLGLQHLGSTNEYANILFVAVGDSLHRDVRFANEAGFLTAYKPSNFRGWEQPKDDAERPTFVIERLGSLIDILKDLGLPLAAAQGRSQ